MVTGLVGNIQHYSIHDGPGIRTTVFLKGCPLRCKWCHNPENLRAAPQLRMQQERCIACGACISGCHEKAIALEPSAAAAATRGSNLIINYELCSLCGKCAADCPALAIELLGRDMTVPEVMTEIQKDAMFYESSGGGVTISGGEPLSQPDFTLALLKELKQEGIHTTLDTSGYAPASALTPCIEYTDVFLYDIKHMDSTLHEQLTGVSNMLILSNLRILAQHGCDIRLRLPVLPGLNDAPAHIAAVGNLADELGIKEVHLLPYHHLARGKYEKLGLTYELPNLAEPTEQQMTELQGILLRKGINAHIGG